MASKKPDLDPMTVMVRTNSMGEIVAIYSALPIRVVKLDSDAKGGELPVRPLTELKEAQTDAVRILLDPWHHLTPAQRVLIAKTAGDTLLNLVMTNDAVRAATIRTHVDHMPIEDQLGTISSDDETVNSILGFVPETGEQYFALPPMSYAKPARMWAKSMELPKRRRQYHWFPETPPENPEAKALQDDDVNRYVRTGKAACGRFVDVFWVGGSPLTVPHTPQPDNGHAGICSDCRTLEPGDEYVEQLVWVFNSDRCWHWLSRPAHEPSDRSKPGRTATVECGQEVNFDVDDVKGVDLGKTPTHVTSYTVCPTCIDRMRTHERDSQ